jgi:hypothetical protein
MCRRRPAPHHVAMTSPRPAVRRVVLVPSPAKGRGDELIRRYRLARVARLRPAEAAPSGRLGPRPLAAR